ncbi:MAG: 3-methyl-2-oxobutanoate dehydrogenase subunit VorB [Candidatus Zixiibacteriota bacterium]
MAKEFIKGNAAIVKGALLAGCDAFFGYPITPASEVAETAAAFFPKLGRPFLQAESEIASIQMCYGAAGAGRRVMTASSGPGLSLKMEGISYACGSELPIVIADIMRGGPGLGNIAPEQSDYFQILKGGGHGNYKLIVVAPNSAQEMCDLTILAFELADKYRNPAVVLCDGFIGQMMEPVDFPEPHDYVTGKGKEDWAVLGNKEGQPNLINSIYLAPEELEEHNQKLIDKYKKIEENEGLYEEYMTDDAAFVGISYGIVSRVMKSAVDKARADGIKAGMLRPKTLFPFPKKKIGELGKKVKSFLVVEMSDGQMIEDVKLASDCNTPTAFFNRMGGVVPTVEEIYNQFKKLNSEV